MTMISMKYNVENQWGGSDAPWHEGGLWIIGGRDNQGVVALQVESQDEGQTFAGTMTYANEGPIGFRAERTDGNSYTVENQWGGSSAPWHPGGQWVLGGREGQSVVSINVASSNGGSELTGEMVYAGEGPIGFKAQRLPVTTYKVLVPAGPLWSDDDAKGKAPKVAAAHQGRWTGQWNTVVPNQMSVIEVELDVSKTGTDEYVTTVLAGPLWSNDEAQQIGPVIAASYGAEFTGQWTTIVPNKMSVIEIKYTF